MPLPALDPTKTRALRSSFATVLLVTAFAAPAAQAADGRAAADQWLADLKAFKGVEVRGGTITEEDGGRKVVVSNVSIDWSHSFDFVVRDETADQADSTTPGTKTPGGDTAGKPTKSHVEVKLEIELPKVTFEDFAEHDGLYSAKRIDVPAADIVMDATGGAEHRTFSQSYALKDLTAEGASWPRTPAIPDDPKHPFSRFKPLIDASAKLALKHWSVGGATIDTVQAGTRQTTTYGGLEARDIDEGRIGSMIARDSATRATVDEPAAAEAGKSDAGPAPQQTFSLAQKTAEYRNYDYGLLARSLFGSPETARAPAQLLEYGGVEGFTMEFPEASVSIARESVERMTAAVPSVSVADLIDKALSGEEIDPVAASDILMTYAGGFAVGRVGLNGLGVEGGPARGKIGEIAASGLDASGIREIAVSDVAIEEKGEKNTFSLGRFALTDIRFPTKAAILALIKIGVAQAEVETPKDEGAPPAPDDAPDGGPDKAPPADSGEPKVQKTEAVPDPTTRQMLDAVPMLGGFTIEKVRYATEGSDALSLDRLALAQSAFVPPIPTAVSLKIAKLEVPEYLLKSGEDDETFTYLKELGLVPLRFDGEFGLKWDAATGDAMLSPFRATVEHGGVLNAFVALAGVPQSVFENPDEAQTALPSISVKSAHISLSNAEAIQRFIAAQAKESGLPADALTTGLVQTAQEMVADVAGEAFAARVKVALERFLKDPTGTLRFEAKPAAPVPLTQVIGAAMLAPSSLIGLLSVEATATR
ncbi:hypothetical protein [Segnochrobactrum spirostomi]|uniref:DUF2125 domain-containing protein n=1 Tax=Segnochrobactrum spirostomi TaxID=2608987 RepID=A0A6A7XYT0_9HYPH|nr:hypothetical protein [Segnochrobactrum spirostomi]MQT11277.1 hypothetical protein [Segnochrobactrum spirostomi]